MTETASKQSQSATPTFKGNADEQLWARRVYEAMISYGSFFSSEAPIRQTLENLSEYLAGQHNGKQEELAPLIDRAIQKNSDVFQREQQEEMIIYSTSKTGRYTEPREDDEHGFAQRLYEPEKPLPVDDLSVVITTTRPSLTTVEPVYISDYWRAQVSGGGSVDGQDEEIVELDEQPALPAVERPAIERPAVEAPELVEAVAPAAPPAHSGALLTLEDGTQLDLRRPVDELIATSALSIFGAVRHGIEQDPLRRIVSFGTDYYPEELISSFSKGDYRRIREYILEQGEPLPDTMLMSDLFSRTPRDRDFETFRFALNYRLNREKDFEFVGVGGARLWSTKGLPTIGSKRIKASELGQLFSFLEEGYDDSLQEATAASIAQARQISRFLTFFEREFGVLPLDGAMKALLPPALLPEQRSSVLRFESPQHYTSYLVEVRYPSGNRGGWVEGLEEFFREFLVPGAMITISATEEANVFTIQYEETSGEEAKVLSLDEKKGRYAFAPATFYCAVDGDLVTTQERLTRLRNMKLLTPGERRRLDLTLSHVFETVGIQKGEAHEIALNDLYLATNVQRPASRSAILSTLESDKRFAPEGDAYRYIPVHEEVEEADEDEDEE